MLDVKININFCISECTGEIKIPEINYKNTLPLKIYSLSQIYS